MLLREHEISDRRLSEPSYSVAPISLMDPTDWRRPVSLVVFGCLSLVILAHDSWVNHWYTFSGRIVIVLKNQLDIGLSAAAWFVYSHQVMGPK
ncbi:hypothetical protein Naga_100294g8 [Nannochloropsis gaditana]|uniref:Uncharacterized protein n=1 Tax=Nannochloropsis gaditana TaxID=72520 RepID=W7TMS5_9STRA|nr:hypothetical protein Naga_100294g8 [Nannochloropsis gaditana]